MPTPTIPFTPEQMLQLIHDAGPRLRAEAEERAHRIYDCYRRAHREHPTSSYRDESMWRGACGRARYELFQREVAPLTRHLVRVKSLSMPSYRCMRDGAGRITDITQVDDGLTPETRAVVDHVEACIAAYAAVFAGEPQNGTPAAAKAGHQPQGDPR